MMNDETTPDEYHARALLGVRPGHAWVGLTPGTPVTGLWCDTCLLPSRYETSVYVLGDNGPVRVGTVARCATGGHA